MNKGLHAVRVKRFSALAPPPLGTALYYPGLPGFGSTITDRSGKENHGAITGATWTRLPNGLMVLSYDGSDDFTSCGNGASLNITGAISVFVWIKIPASTTYERILTKYRNVAAGNQQGYVLQLRDTGVIHGEVTNNANYNVYGTTVLDDNKFHLVGMTWTPGENIKLYVDGAAESVTVTGTAPATIGVTAEPLYIGRMEYQGVYYYGDGQYASPRVVNRVVTAGEAASDYQRTHHLFGV